MQLDSTVSSSPCTKAVRGLPTDERVAAVKVGIADDESDKRRRARERSLTRLLRAALLDDVTCVVLRCVLERPFCACWLSLVWHLRGKMY